MKIAELFVSLGVKGSESAGKAIQGTTDGLKGILSSGLAAKAMIAGVVYGLERMMSASAQAGTSLVNASAFTGISARSLQQWQYAARQAGMSAEEMNGNITAVQASMTKMRMTGQAPAGVVSMANMVGFDPKKAEDTLYVLSKIQEFVQKVHDPGAGNELAASFGVSQAYLAAGRRNIFTDANFNRAPTYSEGEVKSLDKTNIAMLNLEQKVGMIIGRLTAAHGGQLINDLSNIATSVGKLADALSRLSEQLQVFKALGYAAKEAASVTGLVANTVDRAQGKNVKGEGIIDFAKNHKWVGGAPRLAAEFITGKIMDTFGTPKMAAATSGGGGTTNVEVNQTFKDPGTGHQAIAAAAHAGAKAGVNKAYANEPSRSWIK